jgi:hypothetical protein
MSSHAVRASQATTSFTITSISALLSAAYLLLVSGIWPGGILPAHLALMPLRMSSLRPLSQDPELNRQWCQCENSNASCVLPIPLRPRRTCVFWRWCWRCPGPGKSTHLRSAIHGLTRSRHAFEAEGGSVFSKVYTRFRLTLSTYDAARACLHLPVHFLRADVSARRCSNLFNLPRLSQSNLLQAPHHVEPVVPSRAVQQRPLAPEPAPPSVLSVWLSLLASR